MHACWSTDDIAHLATVLDDDHTLDDRVVIDGTTEGTATCRAVENVLKGPETGLAGHRYADPSGVIRSRARVAWWRPDAATLRDAAVIPNGTPVVGPDGEPVDALPATPLTDAVPRYTADVPVLFGHYWRTGRLTNEGPKAACVDYSAGKGGPLVAYRWDGESDLADAKLIAC